jgi:hypothetical protein
MADGVTSADNSAGSYLKGEQITLSTTGSPTSYSWSLAKPAGSTTSCDLSGDDDASVLFTPDVAGYYTAVCVVDGTTTYILRMSVIDVSLTTMAQGFRLMPILAASVPVPSLGTVVYYDKTLARLRRLTSGGSHVDFDPSAMASSFTLVGGTKTIANSHCQDETVIAHHCSAAVNRGTLVFVITRNVGFTVTSSSGTDGSTYSYSLINAYG